MANSQSYCDSPFPSPISEAPAASGMRGIIPAKPALLPALPEGQAPAVPGPYILSDSTAMYVGHSADRGRGHQERGAPHTTPFPDRATSSTSTID
jgi:hypothetical protein